jgi:hypothetical protein
LKASAKSIRNNPEQTVSPIHENPKGQRRRGDYYVCDGTVNITVI